MTSDRRALCGTLQSRDATTSAYRMLRPYRPRELSAPADERLITNWDLWLRDQQSFGSCVGQAVSGAVETQLGDVRRLSGVSVWREARRQQGEIEQIDVGTRVEYGIAAIEERGYSDPWHPGEDRDKVEAGKGATVAGDDLADELAAYDTVHHTIDHSTIWGFGESLYRALQLALTERDAGIVIATGLRDPFFDLAPDEVATIDHIGGPINGHALLLVGYRTRNGKLEWLLRNSWGPHWGGATVSGQFRTGLFWCSSEAINVFWEFHALRVVR